LCARQQELTDLNTRVFIISFGTFPAVQQWMKETCGNFTVLLDRERSVYQAYQLEQSKLRSRSPRTLWLYFTRWLQGQKFHDSHGDDTSQLGGDFIIDKQGNLRFIYPSHDPADRPSVEKLLAVLKDLYN
jgi:peroxiredoxin